MEQVSALAQGMQLLKAGNIDDAVLILEKAAIDTPNDPAVHMCLGAACNQKKDTPRAITAFEKALQLEKSAKSHYNLGVAYESASRLTDAAAQYSEALRMDPSYSAASQALQRVGHKEPVAAASPVSVSSAPDYVEPTALFEQPKISQPADPILRDIERARHIQESKREMIRSGLIYGVLCGAGFLFLVQLMFSVFALPGAMMFDGGSSLIIGLLLSIVKGAAVGAVVGLYIGYTCGGDREGFLAGAIAGFIYGLVTALIKGAGGEALIAAIISAGFTGLFGYFVGRMVEASIGN